MLKIRLIYYVIIFFFKDPQHLKLLWYINSNLHFTLKVININITKKKHNKLSKYNTIHNKIYSIEWVWIKRSLKYELC